MQEEKTGGKLNNFLNSKYFVPIVLVLVAIIAFCLGRVSGLQEKRPTVKIIDNRGEVKGVSTNSLVASDLNNQAQPSQNAMAGAVVASKNGAKYHYPWCAGAKQISPANLITFDSIEKARAAGLTPASNCKGLK